MSTRLLDALKALREVAPILAEHKSPAGFSYAGGICWNIEQFIARELRKDCPDLDYRGYYIAKRNAHDEMGQLMARWPKCSKHFRYPVDGLEEFDSNQERGTLWNNPKRLELLEWCIEQLETEQ